MGIFHTPVNVFNVAPEAITVRYNGQDLNLPPGPGQLPEVAVLYGQNQNPIMGSQDPLNPHPSGARYLLRVVGTNDCTPLTADEWRIHLGQPCRMDTDAMFADEYGNDPKAKMVVRGKGRKSVMANAGEARSALGANRTEMSND